MNAVIHRLRALLQKPGQPTDDQEYEQLVSGPGDDTDAESQDASTLREPLDETPFYWLEYAVFLLLGVAMLWAW
jgi:equilibrative nucleoside transporter 1/2/3